MLDLKRKISDYALGKFAAALVAASLAFSGAAQADAPKLQLNIAGEANGAVTIQLRPDLAPKHVEQITTLAKSGAYDGVIFHRVINGFMAQTGDVQFGKQGADISRAGSGGSDLPDLPSEFTRTPFVVGTVGMARSRHPDSANSQFFIMFAPAPHLDGQYTVVGEVVEGIDTVMKIKRGHHRTGTITGEADVMTSVKVID